jgi:hypothetical protein
VTVDKSRDRRGVETRAGFLFWAGFLEFLGVAGNHGVFLETGVCHFRSRKHRQRNPQR